MTNYDEEYFLLPDSDFEDGDEYPDDEQILRDAHIALQEYAEWERCERYLRVTPPVVIVNAQEPQVILTVKEVVFTPANTENPPTVNIRQAAISFTQSLFQSSGRHVRSASSQVQYA
jgi:hypothetical protein